MGFTNKSHSAIKFIKIQGLKKEAPYHYFECEGKEIEEKTFEARLIKISPSEYEYEGVMKQTIKFLFIDDNMENYQLDISYNGLSRGLLNTLLGCIDNYKKAGLKHGKMLLELSLYLNKDNYKQMGIKINGSRENWRYSIEEQRKMIETITKKNGSKENDYFEYDEKLKNSIQEIQDFITVSDFLEMKREEVKEEISVEDIPF